MGAVVRLSLPLAVAVEWGSFASPPNTAPDDDGVVVVVDRLAEVRAELQKMCQIRSPSEGTAPEVVTWYNGYIAALTMIKQLLGE